MKLALKDEVLASDLPDAEVFARTAAGILPRPAARAVRRTLIGEHPLRREIITTLLVNEVVDRGGITYAYRLAEELSASATDAVRAYFVAAEVFDLRALWQAIAALGNLVPISVADAMMLEPRRLLDRVSRWLLPNRPQPLAVGAEIDRFGAHVRELAPRVPDWLDRPRSRRRRGHRPPAHRAGVPEELALRASAGLTSFGLLDVIEVAELAKMDPEPVAALYYALSAHLGIDRMLGLVSELARGDRWHALARLTLRDDLYASLRKITLDALHTGDVGVHPATTIAGWERRNSARLSRARATLNEISDPENLDLATLSVAVRALARL